MVGRGGVMVAVAMMAAGVAAGQEQAEKGKGEGEVLTLHEVPLPSAERAITGPARLAMGANGTVPIPSTGARFTSPGETKEITLGGEKVTLKWESADEFSVTAGGKTRSVRPAPKTYGLETVKVSLPGGREYSLAFPVAQVGKSGDQMQAAVFYHSGTAQSGEMEGKTLWLYDVNTDGVYAAEDGVRLGSATKVPVFAPIREYLATPQGIYRLMDLAADGSSLRYSKYVGASGTLKIEGAPAGSEVDLILVSADGKSSAVASSADRELPLQAGTYTATYAVVSMPASGKIVAAILPGSIKPVEIEAAQVKTLELGSPLTLEFRVETDGDTVRVDPQTFALRGKGGERYVQYRWSQRPDVTFKPSGGALRRLGKMPIGVVAGVGEFKMQVQGAQTGKIGLEGVVEGLGVVKGQER